MGKYMPLVVRFCLEPGSERRMFMHAYGDNPKSAIEAGLEGSPMATELIAMMEKRKEPWTGTANNLLQELSSHADEHRCGLRSWPKSATGLGSQLRRLAPAFEPSVSSTTASLALASEL
jgi:hypothetical protein